MPAFVSIVTFFFKQVQKSALGFRLIRVRVSFLKATSRKFNSVTKINIFCDWIFYVWKSFMFMI